MIAPVVPLLRPPEAMGPDECLAELAVRLQHEPAKLAGAMALRELGLLRKAVCDVRAMDAVSNIRRPKSTYTPVSAQSRHG